MQGSREYPTRPIVGVGGVVIQHRRALLIRRARPPQQGQWSVPGGGLEVGETIADGIRREVQEETGIEVRVLEQIGVFERIVRDDSARVQYHYVLVDHLCEVTGGALRAGGDAADAVWASEEELEGYALTDTALRVIRKAFDAAKGDSRQAAQAK
jgi:8-oxo-dGTP diphosphatase